MVRQGIRKLLEAEPDFEVVGEAGTGEEAVKLVAALKPDVLVIEARLPGLNSLSVVKRLICCASCRAILILTTYEGEGQSIELLRVGAGVCIFKTADYHDLAQAIRTVRAGHFVCDLAVERELLKRAMPAEPAALENGGRLTQREAEVLNLAAKGYSNRDIAKLLFLTEGTVKGYLSHIFSKMGVTSRIQAVRKGLKEGWISLGEESGDGFSTT